MEETRYQLSHGRPAVVYRAAETLQSKLATDTSSRAWHQLLWESLRTEQACLEASTAIVYDSGLPDSSSDLGKLVSNLMVSAVSSSSTAEAVTGGTKRYGSNYSV